MAVVINATMTNKKYKPLPLDFKPCPKCVLFGRVKAGCEPHKGNLRMRKICNDFSNAYGSATSKQEKIDIVNGIIQTTTSALNPQGLKGKKEEGEDSSKTSSRESAKISKKDPDLIWGSKPCFVIQIDGKWYEADRAKVREKIGGILRELLHSKYASSSKAKRKKAKDDKLLKKMKRLREQESIHQDVHQAMNKRHRRCSLQTVSTSTPLAAASKMTVRCTSPTTPSMMMMKQAGGVVVQVPTTAAQVVHPVSPDYTSSSLNSNMSRQALMAMMMAPHNMLDNVGSSTTTNGMAMMMPTALQASQMSSMGMMHHGHLPSASCQGGGCMSASCHGGAATMSTDHHHMMMNMDMLNRRFSAPGVMQTSNQQQMMMMVPVPVSHHHLQHHLQHQGGMMNNFIDIDDCGGMNNNHNNRNITNRSNTSSPSSFCEDDDGMDCSRSSRGSSNSSSTEGCEESSSPSESSPPTKGSSTTTGTTTTTTISPSPTGFSTPCPSPTNTVDVDDDDDDDDDDIRMAFQELANSNVPQDMMKEDDQIIPDEPQVISLDIIKQEGFFEEVVVDPSPATTTTTSSQDKAMTMTTTTTATGVSTTSADDDDVDVVINDDDILLHCDDLLRAFE